MRTFTIHKPDEAIKPALLDKIDNLNKPKGSLGRLEELAAQIGLIQQSLSPSLQHPCHLLLGGDHGIEREKVSVSPREVTWQQMINFTRGGGGVNLFCRQHGFELVEVDTGVDYDLSAYPTIINMKVGRGTRNFLHEAAMTYEEMNQCIENGAQLVNDCHAKGCNVICLGEMGIANTSPSSIWMSLMGQLELSICVGAGAGLNDTGIFHKLQVLQQSIDQFYSNTRGNSHLPEEIIRWFGGYEMVTAIGAMLQAAQLHMVVLVDGFIMTACMLAASKLYPEVLHYAIFGHQGDESGHKLMLQLMDAKPILNMGLRLGEGTGALCAYPIVESAVRMINEMNSFETGEITKYF
ncbi:MAG: nicotinate-nucleotide--dimethylbenzimidazole phosphoribosyltransferase [Bacteroidaceae bacterium]|nr:nicotinate-nucleotide--dimethylbenzimidazole phosphoribosyltransferase [Candidatus Minthousia equi]MCQ2246175.1 nicotinate-nucleotide--dimethylbenzimidazole phosphoribosyltransferase [Bacteroidaceae bacterium]